MKKKRLYIFLGLFLFFLLPSLYAYTADNYTNVTLTIPDGAYSADVYTNVTLIIGEFAPPNTPVITLNSPTSGSEITDNDSALLNVTVSNPDGTNMNVSFYSVYDYCFQEFTNQSDSKDGLCTLNFTDGNYNFSDNFNDGNDSSYIIDGLPGDARSWNYSIPEATTEATWQGIYGVSAQTYNNITIPESCLDNGDNILQMMEETFYCSRMVLNFSCYDGAAWENIATAGDCGIIQTLYLYEEGIFWNVTEELYNETGVVNNTEVTYNWTGLTDGTYYWYANVTEAGGNYTTSNTWNFTIDRPYWAPDNFTLYIYKFNFSIVLPANGSFVDTNTDIPLNFTYGNIFGVDDCVYNLTGPTTLTDVFVADCANATFNAGDGEYVLDVIANDTNGNSVTNQTNFTVDATLPQIEIVHPTNTSYINNVSQLVNITITDDNPHTTWYNWEGVNVTYTTAVNVTFQEGSITLVVYANDSAGNENSKNVTFFIDTLYPQIEIINPTATNYSYDNIRVNISATDANLNTTWYNWNGTNITYTSEINITFDEGENTLTAYANDSYGNENSTNVTFRVDTTYPQISFGSGTAANDSFNCDKITVNVSLNETNFQNITYSLFNHSSGVVVNQTTYTSKILTLNWTLTSSDYYDFNVTSCDNVGNCNSTETRTVTVGTCYDIDITLSNGITVFIWNVSNMTGTFQPLYQTSLLGILNVSNNESSTLDIIMKFNETSGLSNITVKANDVYNYSTAVTVEDSYVAIIEDLAAGDYNMIWMWADYNDSRRAWFPEMSVVGI